MTDEHIKNLMTAALTDFLKSEAGENLIGNIVFKAVNQALLMSIQYEDGKSEPGRVVEKTETVHMAHWLAKYMPHIEGSIRGCQADAAAARNRAATTENMMTGLVDAFGRIASGADPAAAALDLAERHKQLLIDYQK